MNLHPNCPNRNAFPHAVELDGYRGVAILLVIAFHVGWFRYGWVGVPMFFTLSGFLITKILRRAKDRPFGDHYLDFFKRRARRLVPLYLLYLAVLAAVAGRNISPAHWIGLLTGTMNFASIWDPGPALGYAHFWSLAIEWQFYAVWPFAVYFLKLQGLQTLGVALVGLAPGLRAASQIALQAASLEGPAGEEFFYLVPTSHCDSLAFGALLAVGLPDDWRIWAQGAFGLLLSTGIALFATRAIWTLSLVACASFALMMAAQRTRLKAVFAHPALTYTGTISYSLYVWHLGISELVAHWSPLDGTLRAKIVEGSAVFALSYPVAALSWRYWERRFWHPRPSPIPALPTVS